ncbi:helix-turn-helix domain-containing protein [Aureimonas fodinaquatilis]|uniref:Helix-turn-helix domain-containing protein n=1 Tax=Aureimonas fodinaquatilis TaxID=2565783 RepID=A0A5B0DVA7_9HYPH|nr:SMP-30/gluconolactonase/LRE family protein [Aureimonas fodinaquatilis]KAA0970757.1 helix-turn-helix domain-containing protein [Aureimonas fodinaquatilis]
MRKAKTSPDKAKVSDSPVAGTASLTKGLQVLLLLGEESQAMRFTDLANRLGLSKATLHRILSALARFDLVRYDSSEQVYVLGPRFLALAHSVWGNVDVRSVAASEMERLVIELQETVGLAQLDELNITIVDERETDAPLGVRFAVGRRDPAFCTAPGKIMLAYRDAEQRTELLNAIPFQAFTDKTLTDARAFEAELELCRARGYAISDQEQIAGVRSVAAPVFAPNGIATAAIFVSGPTVRLDMERLHIVGRDLMKVAHRITGNLGGTALHLDTPEAAAVPTRGVELLYETHALLGDSPYWSMRDQKFYWVDILHPSVSRMTLGGSDVETVALTELVGFVADRQAGGCVIATQSGVQGLHFESGALTAIADPGETRAFIRFNDGKCDRAGRLWAGTMSMDVAPEKGSLYSLDKNLRLKRMVSDVTISNGLAWSPDNRTMYFADSGKQTIYAYDFDFETGEISGRREFYNGSRLQGRPSGLTVDAEGAVWCAIWDGWSVIRLRPDGQLDRTITLPVPRPTSCSFVGEKLDILAITSARIRLSEASLKAAPLSGSIFAFTPGVSGLPEVPFHG